MQFSRLDDFIGTENTVRIIDAFVEKLDFGKLGISSTIQPIPGKNLIARQTTVFTKLKLMQVVTPIAKLQIGC